MENKLHLDVPRRSREKPSNYALNLLYFNNNPDESLKEWLVEKTNKQTNKQTDKQTSTK